MSEELASRIAFRAACEGEPTVFGDKRPGCDVTHPSVEDVSRWISFMKKKDIRRVCCLLSSSQLGQYETDLLGTYRGVFGADRVCSAPVEDFHLCDVATLKEEILPFLRDADLHGERALVHCSGGSGRTGHVLAAWLVYRRGYSPDEALEAVKATGRTPEEAIHNENATWAELDALLQGCRQEWTQVQESIDACPICQCQIGVLFDRFKNSHGRPPTPTREGLLFISHAPPPKGGFWADPGDSLRRNLFDLLHLPEGDTGLRQFTSKNLSLVQTFKWPLRIELAGLEPKRVRPLSEHTARAHLVDEVVVMAPWGILALGSIAVSALSWLMADGDVRSMYLAKRVKEYKGKIFDAVVNARKVKVCATYLPAGQGTRHKEAIRPDVEEFFRNVGRY